ncbi:MAG: hypothetical protein LLG40_11325 [Deltaproteobacteria bacterium]|nr:hypothetical protein [Deltaproteobacteria bacterium]
MKKNNLIDTPENRQRLLACLATHISAINAIAMTALYYQVFDRPWEDHVNSTRAIRHLITAMRNEGVPICSASSSNGGGYYLAAAGSEMADFLRKTERRALRILKRNAAMKKTTLPNYLGQLKIEMETR